MTDSEAGESHGFKNNDEFANKFEDELSNFKRAAEFATETLTAELTIVDPDLICLCSAKAIRNLPVTECSLLADPGTYANLPSLTLDGRTDIEDVLGGIYATNQFPAPVALFPHPLSFDGHSR